MGISKRTLETLIDLVEIKLSCMDVYDRDDSRELAHLERCLGELKAITGHSARCGVVDLQQPALARPGRSAH